MWIKDFFIYLYACYLVVFTDVYDYDANNAGTNPWRPLPEDPAILNTMKEVVYIGRVLLRDLMPVSLPGEDDEYAHVSAHLSNLARRKDLTLGIIEETGIDTGFAILYEMRRLEFTAVAPDEPAHWNETFSELYTQWTAFWNETGVHVWDAAMDTTYVPPIKGEHVPAKGDEQDGGQLLLHPQDQAYADALFAQYLARRDRKYRYFHEHPPKPIAFNPAPGYDLATAWELTLPGTPPPTPTDNLADGHFVSTAIFENATLWHPTFRRKAFEEPPEEWEARMDEADEAAKNKKIVEAYEEARWGADRREKQEYKDKLMEVAMKKLWDSMDEMLLASLNDTGYEDVADWLSGQISKEEVAGEEL